MLKISKKKVLKAYIDLLIARDRDLCDHINEIKEGLESETKSSAGDKYETGRSMMQLEIEKLENQRQKSKKSLSLLNQIDPSYSSTKINYGSLVETNQGIFFVGLGLGKIEIANQIIMAISLQSPLGQMFKDKNTNDAFHFNNKQFIINSIQ